MEIISKYISDDLLFSVGWTIFHSIWIGAIISLLLLMTLKLLTRSSAGVRYKVALTALALFMVIVGTVFIRTMDSPEANILDNSNILSGSSESYSPLLLMQDAGLSNLDINNGMGQTIILFLNNNYSLISILWLTGLLIMIVRFAGGIFYTGKLKKNGRLISNNNIARITTSLKEKIGIKRSIKIIESAIAKIPMTTGWLKPVLYIPVGTLMGIPYNQVEAIIAHELAHIKRNDYLVNILQSLAEIVMFYHPAVWWMSSLIRTEREIACDDIAIKYSDEKLTYVKALMSISEINAYKIPAAVAFAGDNRNLLNRIKRITKMTHPKLNRTDKLTSALMSIVLIAGILIITGFRTEPGIDEAESMLTNISESRMSDDIFPWQQYTSDMQDTIKLSGKIDRNIIDPRDNKEKEAFFTFKDGKLTELVIDGKTIPASDYYIFEDIINEVKDDLADALADMEDALIDIEEALEELEEIDMEEIEFEVQEALKEIEEIDFEAMELEIQEALEDIKEFDFEELQLEMQKAMTEMEESLKEVEEIDFKKIELEMQKAMQEIQEIDIEAIRSEVMESLKEVEEIDIEKIRKEMEHSMQEIQESLSDIRIDHKKAMEDHKKNIELHKKELEKQIIEMQENKKEEMKQNEAEKKKKVNIS